MKWLSGFDVRIVLPGLAAVILMCASASADFTFGTSCNLGANINSPSDEWDPCISADGLSLYFTSYRPGGYGESDLLVTTRESIIGDWGEAANLGPVVNSTYQDNGPSISSDGLELYFDSSRPGGLGARDLWVTTRATKDDDWAPPVNLEPVVNSSADDQNPSISADGLELFFESRRAGGLGNYDLWVTTRGSRSSPWGTPVNLGPLVNSLYITRGPSISSDGLLLFLGALRAEQSGLWDFDIWVITRATRSDPWPAPVNLGPTLNTVSGENNPHISADGLWLFFVSDRPGGLGNHDIWQVPIVPAVDLNWDGIVDLSDFSRLARYWQQNERSVDIAPPIGNGIVDVQDMAVLAEYWLTDFRLVAYWRLDETEGAVAHDSVSEKDGALHGEPLWQPTGGKVHGALELDGTDDYVSTPSVLNPADGAFSVFSWIKGGMPGQVIMSQIGGANWLSADSSEGTLMTDLSAPAGRFPPQPLASQSVITDGQWHRVGFAWDGSNRVLYVDDAEVAKGTQAKPASSTGGLYIGAGKNLEPGSFFSGLIDDVRIYNRAVTP